MKHTPWKNVGTFVVACTAAVGLLVGASGAQAKGPGIHAQVYKTAERLEIKPLPKKPDWADVDEPPLFTFAWVSDFHLSESRLELTSQALRFIDEELKARFVMITGDNNAYAPQFEYEGRVPPTSLRRQLFMKRFLDENLRAPYVIIPGDDWPQDSEKVFGAFQFSFDYGGLHFLFTSLDACAYGVEGRAVFDESTFKWMRQDLARNKDRPALFVMHESLIPPSFLDATKAREMLSTFPNVLASFCGHLHVDVDFTEGSVRCIACPGLGPSPRHGLKHVKVYRHALILRTVEYNSARKRFERVMKWQKIDVPEPLRAKLHKPRSRAFRKQNYREIPPHPRRSAPELMKRTMELVGPLLKFTGQRLTGGGS